MSAFGKQHPAQAEVTFSHTFITRSRSNNFSNICRCLKRRIEKLEGFFFCYVNKHRSSLLYRYIYISNCLSCLFLIFCHIKNLSGIQKQNNCSSICRHIQQYGKICISHEKDAKDKRTLYLGVQNTP